MKLSQYTSEELNAMNSAQLSEVLSENIPKIRHNIETIERNLGTSQAIKGLYSMYPNGIPYKSAIREMTFNEKRELAFSLKQFQMRKTSTLQGSREHLMNVLKGSMYNDEQAKAFRIGAGGYRKVSELLNMLDDIRGFSPELEYTIGSDGGKMNAIFKAFAELSPKDRKDPQKIAERAVEIYNEHVGHIEQTLAFPFTINRG